MLKFIIICIGILLLILLGYYFIMAYIDSKEDKALKEDKFWKTERNSLQIALLDKIEKYDYSELLNHLFSYELFKDDCIKRILNELDYTYIKENLKINDNRRRPVEEKIKEYAEYILTNDREIDQFLVTIFIKQVTKNIEEGEKIEKEHETLVKAYGNDDNVQLRKAEQDEEDEEVPDSTIDDLYKSKLIEDIDE